MRPTVNDIAREAGVSLATVDRVMNARPGVRGETVARVQAAVARLGYVRDLAAANLARQRDYRAVFVLPDRPAQVLQTLAATIEAAAATASAQRIKITLLRLPAADPHALAASLAGLDAVDGVAIMAPETPPLRDAVRALRARGVAVVAMISDLPASACDRFVGIDNRAAGRVAAVLTGRFLPRQPAAILVLAESTLLRETAERRAGFDAVMQRDFPHLAVLHTLEGHGEASLVRRGVGRMLAQRPDIAAVYALGAGLRALDSELVEAGRRPVVIAHELTPHSRAALEAGRIDAVIAQNLGHVVRAVLRVLRATSQGLPIDAAQETIRIDIILRENLPPE